MSTELEINSTLKCKAGFIRVIKYMASGAQAEIYVVELNGQKYALKYYFKPLCIPQFKKNLQDIIAKPVDSDSFIWPLYMVENGDRFGYIMKLIPDNYKDVSEWLSNGFNTTIDVIVKACINLCEAFHKLHSSGYSYKDISSSNICFSPETGNVYILDNDNVTPNLGKAGVVGTVGFMAPELVDGFTKIPSRLTDIYSLAVVLFQMLMGEHPLNGKKEYEISHKDKNDDEIAKELYGSDGACFIFKDPYDLDRYIETSEEAHINAREMWKYYPKYIRKTFTKVFVEGIEQPHERLQAVEWEYVFIRLLAGLYKCPNCDYPHFYDRDYFFDMHGKPKCLKCESNMYIPRMKINTDIIISLSNGTPIYACYFDPDCKLKFEIVLMTELENGKLRFKNTSNYKVEYNFERIERGKYTQYITNSCKEIRVENKTYKLSL